MSKLYYEAPTDEQFSELKEKAIKIWGQYDDTYGYASEKINGIKDIKNIRDNFMFIVAMFDIQNQRKLSLELSDETRQAVRDRMIDGGNSIEYIVF